jgi:1,4-dihydroxy-6-naphthoate synthase
VNQFSHDLGEEGYAAVTALLSRAAEEGLVPKVDLEALRW